MENRHPTVTVTTRGDVANRLGSLRTAVIVFIDPSDQPFLQDWLDASKDGGWGAFFPIFMEDTALPEAHWSKALDPKWWRPLST